MNNIHEFRNIGVSTLKNFFEDFIVYSNNCKDENEPIEVLHSFSKKLFMEYLKTPSKSKLRVLADEEYLNTETKKTYQKALTDFLLHCHNIELPLDLELATYAYENFLKEDYKL